MISKLSISAIAVLCFLASGVKGQGCVPMTVRYITVTPEHVLIWDLNPKERCDVDEYIVDMLGDRDDEHHFRVKETSMNLSFLEVCEVWTFVVTPVADGVVGRERRHEDYIPLPGSADLSIQSLDILPQNPRELLIKWNLTDHSYGYCTLRYRLVVEDQETGHIQDIYVLETSTVLRTLSPCGSYEISISAINRVQPVIEGPKTTLFYDMPAQAELAPTLKSLEMGATTADLLFDLEPVQSNRCPVRTLFVDAGSFNISVPLQNTAGERPPVEVNLRALRPDSMYLLKVSVENSGGISRAAQFGVQTVAMDPGRK